MNNQTGLSGETASINNTCGPLNDVTYITSVSEVMIVDYLLRRRIHTINYKM